MSDPSMRLTRSADRRGWIDSLAALHGGRAGLDVVLGDLDRRAVRQAVPVRTAVYGFRWDDEDFAGRQWWPQGITTSADAGGGAGLGGRSIVVVGWYDKGRPTRPSRGTRLSFVDVTEEARPTYRHVLLIQPAVDEATGEVSARPVRVHAGGVVWYGRSMLVADTHGGLRTFSLDDILRIGDGGYDGYRYTLPQRTSYTAVADDGFEPFRFSFVSLDRGRGGHELLAGEYGREQQTTRLVRFALDAAEEAPAMVDDAAHPRTLIAEGLTHMQGATVVEGTYYISTSRGRRRGTMWTRREGQQPREHPASLAVGPEDLTYWPQRDQIWNVSEYPGQRFVYAMPRSAFALPPGRLRALLLRLAP